MSLHGFLTRVPKGIKFWANLDMKAEARGHDTVLHLVGGMWIFLIILVPITKFPITMNPASLESLALPDYGSGKIYTQFRRKYKSYDFI